MRARSIAARGATIVATHQSATSTAAASRQERTVALTVSVSIVQSNA
jgi:hypothetical protein